MTEARRERVDIMTILLVYGLFVKLVYNIACNAGVATRGTLAVHVRVLANETLSLRGRLTEKLVEPKRETSVDDRVEIRSFSFDPTGTNRNPAFQMAASRKSYSFIYDLNVQKA